MDECRDAKLLHAINNNELSAERYGTYTKAHDIQISDAHRRISLPIDQAEHFLININYLSALSFSLGARRFVIICLHKQLNNNSPEISNLVFLRISLCLSEHFFQFLIFDLLCVWTSKTQNVTTKYYGEKDSVVFLLSHQYLALYLSGIFALLLGKFPPATIQMCVFVYRFHLFGCFGHKTNKKNSLSCKNILLNFPFTFLLCVRLLFSIGKFVINSEESKTMSNEMHCKNKPLWPNAIQRNGINFLHFSFDFSISVRSSAIITTTQSTRSGGYHFGYMSSGFAARTIFISENKINLMFFQSVCRVVSAERHLIWPCCGWLWPTHPI